MLNAFSAIIGFKKMTEISRNIKLNF